MIKHLWFEALTLAVLTAFVFSIATWAHIIAAVVSVQ